ncbi:unnamed protein product, partial [Musa acuminata var. zebrina]
IITVAYAKHDGRRRTTRSQVVAVDLNTEVVIWIPKRNGRDSFGSYESIYSFASYLNPESIQEYSVNVMKR